ncbi:hypothetical protein [Oricola thermophila]|uniref:Uncharacterized protein n=1 Tax=Oricola thermophila TaxID=2742145 RepID=A0A6N1VJ58_9HYPH|nr:hypothetical protein [Oricola thermophila]QKV19422.1 hypothetical protein HTY61_13615 [Oricola thermophila]
MNFLDYALYHVIGVARIVRGDPDALSDMDISADGFWRSFQAIPAAMPALIFAWTTEARQIRAAGAADSVLSMVARMAFLEILFWILPVIALAFVLRALGMSRRFPHLIIARNWLTVLTSYIFVLVPLGEFVFRTGAESDAMLLVTIVTMLLALWFSVRVTRVALSVTPAVAFAFVAVEVFLTYPLAVFAYGAVGLYPQA